jgi:signal transduction histidine kinase/ligand-binding sensor domain-containing protein
MLRLRTKAWVQPMADETVFVRGRKIWLFTALLLSLVRLSRGGEEPPPPDFFFKSWETADGLPGNTVNRVVQDPRGFIWLANIGGLIRFDGIEFKSFDSPLIARGPFRNIRALALEDDATLVMLPATGGVVRRRGATFSPHPVSAGLADWGLQTLYVDPGGALWIGAEDGRIARWKDAGVTKFGAADGLSGHGFRPAFAADREGRVWIAAGDYLGSYANGRLARFAEKIAPSAGAVVLASSHTGGIWISTGSAILKMENGMVSPAIVDPPWAALYGSVDAMLEDRDGALWIGTRSHGLFRFAGGKLSMVPTSQSEIRAISEDREGAIWVGTAGGGVNRLRQKLFRLLNTDSGLPEQVSAAVCADPQGGVWLANRGGGVVRLPAGEIQPLRLQFEGRPVAANTLCADARGGIWFCDDTVYRFDPTVPDRLEKSTQPIPRVNVLYQARNGDIWVGAEYTLLGRFPAGNIANFLPENSFPGRSVRAIAEDPAGRLWIGTERGDLFEYAEGKFTRFGPDAGFPGAPVRAIYADGDGAVWVSTIGAGLVLRRNGRFVQFTTANGLPADSISEILEDDAGRLWLGSQRGMSYVAKRDLLAFADHAIARVNGVVFGESDGLPRISCYGSSQPMAWKDGTGTLWFTTQQGVLALNANALKSNPRPPPIFVDAMLVNDQPVPINAAQPLPPLPRKLEFRFAVLSYAAPEMVRLRYRLEGVDSEWIETTGRSAVYGRLPPGSYRLRATACNNDGRWNEQETILRFTLPPVWWETLWARTTALILFTTGVILGVRLWAKRKLKRQLQQLEREQALARERSRIARDLHDDLGSSLTQIGLMLEELKETAAPLDEMKAQSAVISSRVRYLAQDLNSVVWTINPKNDTLPEFVDHLSRYFLQNLRLSAIRPRLAVMDRIPPRPLSPETRHHLFLVAKEGVNNVLKHSQAAEATLGLGLEGDQFELTLHDDGIGFAPDDLRQSKRHGMQNMRARVVELGGTFEVTSAPGRGTLLRIRIPVPTAPSD